MICPVRPRLLGRRKPGESDASIAQFTGVFPARLLGKLWEKESWDHKEEKGIMNCKCITWDSYSLNRGHFINGNHSAAVGKEANISK